MIIECKEQGVALNDAVIHQILRYNITLDVSVLVITNGENTYAVLTNKNGMQVLDVLPNWID